MIEEIVKSALLGTDKFVPALQWNFTDLPEKISQQKKDKEDIFLKQSALYFVFNQAGILPSKVEFPNFPLEKVQEKVLQSNLDLYIQKAFKENNKVLLQYISHYCLQQHQVIPPIFIPDFLNFFVEDKKFRKYVPITGATGLWLMHWNAEWQPLRDVMEEQFQFETATFEARWQAIKQLRATKPQEVVPLLETFIKDEAADKREAFLEILKENSSLQDEPFLMQFLSDKSKKVRTLVFHILCGIPSGAIHRQGMEIIRNLVGIKEERQLLLMKKKVLVLDEKVKIPKEWLNYGMEEVSKEKGIHDAVFLMGQMLERFPLQMFATSVQVETDEWLQLLSKHPQADFLMHYLGQQAAFYKDQMVLNFMIQQHQKFDLIQYLPFQEALKAYEKALQKEPSQSQNLLATFTEFVIQQDFFDLSNQTCERIFEYLNVQPYSISAAHFTKISYYFPVSMEHSVDKWLLKKDLHYQLTNSLHQTKEILEIKKRINS